MTDSDPGCNVSPLQGLLPLFLLWCVGTVYTLGREKDCMLPDKIHTHVYILPVNLVMGNSEGGPGEVSKGKCYLGDEGIGSKSI